MGYRYDDAVGLPSWLFWRLALSDAKSRVEVEQATSKAVIMGIGGYDKSTIADIQEAWQSVMIQGYVKASPVRDVYTLKAPPPRMSEKQRSVWASFGGRVEATGDLK